MSVDALHLYTNSSVIVYNYYPHGTLLVSYCYPFDQCLFKYYYMASCICTHFEYLFFLFLSITGFS